MPIDSILTRVIKNSRNRFKVGLVLSLAVILFLTHPEKLIAFSAPVLKWQKGGCRTTWCRTGWYASPAVADLDKDGKMEVIWTDYRIVVVNGEDGSNQWVVDNPGGGRGWPGVVVADLDGNQSLEIVTAHSGGYLSVYQANGSPLPGWPQQPTPGNELRSLAVGDVDGNGTLEILTASTRPDNQWFLFNANGTLRPGWPVLSPDSDTNGYAAGCFNENVGLADLDGDGQLEMVGPNDTHYVAAYRQDGTPLRAGADLRPGGRAEQALGQGRLSLEPRGGSPGLRQLHGRKGTPGAPAQLRGQRPLLRGRGRRRDPGDHHRRQPV